MNETSGVLRPAVERYLRGHSLTILEVGALRAYFRQWIARGCWLGGDELDTLRRGVELLHTREDIHHWLISASALGIDPL